MGEKAEDMEEERSPFTLCFKFKAERRNMCRVLGQRSECQFLAEPIGISWTVGNVLGGRA